MSEDIFKLYQGREVAVLMALGLPERIFNGKNQPCILCGGTDRYRWVKKWGSPYCNQCGIRTWVDLAAKYLEISYQELAKKLREMRGYIMNVTPIKPDNSGRAKSLRRVKNIMTDPIPIADTVAEQYLVERGLTAESVGGDYFYKPELDYWGVENDTPVKKGMFPALVGKIRCETGGIVGVQTTYLAVTKDGIRKTRKTHTFDAYRGGGIWLRPLKTASLVVGEGMESCAGYALIHDIGDSALVSALDEGGIEAFNPPGSVEHVTIVGDADANYVGQSSAFSLARKLKKRGLDVKVCIPNLLEDRSMFGVDYCDLLGVA